MSTASDINDNLSKHMRSKIAGLEKLAGKMAQELETEAKTKAPWKNRTGDARKDLFGATETTNEYIRVILSHGPNIYYGLYLERNYLGRYAILYPVMSRNQAKMYQQLKRYWEQG